MNRPQWTYVRKHNQNVRSTNVKAFAWALPDSVGIIDDSEIQQLPDARMHFHAAGIKGMEVGYTLCWCPGTGPLDRLQPNLYGSSGIGFIVPRKIMVTPPPPSALGTPTDVVRYADDSAGNPVFHRHAGCATGSVHLLTDSSATVLYPQVLLQNQQGLVDTANNTLGADDNFVVIRLWDGNSPLSWDVISDLSDNPRIVIEGVFHVGFSSNQHFTAGQHP